MNETSVFSGSRYRRHSGFPPNIFGHNVEMTVVKWSVILNEVKDLF